ncbi:MAG TPA: hypothetical protein VL133_00560 [Devosia sp.]|nr:hypothetical protein [Devosia sp.]
MSAGGEWIPATCSRADLSILFGVSIRTVDNLIATGIVVPAEQRGMYQTLPSVVAYLGDLRNKAAGRSADAKLTEKRGRLLDEQILAATIKRQTEETTLAQLKGSMLTIGEVVEGWSSIIARMKSDLLAIPRLLRASIPHFGAHEQETARTLIHDILTNMADEIETGVVGTHVGNLRDDEP